MKRTGTGTRVGAFVGSARGRLVTACGGLLAALIAAGGTAAQPAAAVRVPPAAEPGRTFTPEELTNIAVYDAVNRSVANINTKASVSSGLFLIEVPSEGAGSGIVLDKQGHVLTNYHVVEGAREIQVLLYDGSSHTGSLVGYDPATDVAVLKVEAPATLLQPVTFGNSNNLHVGQRVFAIGNPFGLERTLTTGIISSLNRSLPTRTGRTIKSIIQTDAGLLVAALAPDGPAERAGMRGFRVIRERRRQGPFVAEFERVDRAGADVIVAVAGETVRTADDFLSAIESKNPGDQVLVTVTREGHRLDLPVILAAEK